VKSQHDLRKLLSQKTWDKDVALWVGAIQPVRDAVTGAGQPITLRELDLLDLLPEKTLPDSEEDIGFALKRALRADLQKRRPVSADRRVLIVKSAALLSRYSLGLKEFFDWFVGDRALVVLALDGVPSGFKQIPAEIELRPEWLLQSLHRPDLAKHVFTAA
jgi:hypothetical protein